MQAKEEMPWPLAMAQWCLESSGRASLPRPGGWLNQMRYEMKAMRLALLARDLYKKGAKWEKHGDFLAWLNDDEDTAVFLVVEYLMELDSLNG